MPRVPKQSKRRFLFFPNLRKINLKDMKWGPGSKAIKTQRIAPRDQLLAKKLGIQPKAKVLVMTGYFGDWARALSNFCEVRYTDISESMTKFAKRKKAKVHSFTSRPAEALVRRPKVYDWSFLFEPCGPNMHLVFVRSLLNKKGCIVVGRSPPTYQAKRIAELYGARATTKSLKIRGILTQPILYPKEKPKYLPVDVLTLHTNEAARKRAMLDLKLSHYLNMAAKNNKPMRLEELCKKLNVSRKQLEESRLRLHEISSDPMAEEQNKYLQ